MLTNQKREKLRRILSLIMVIALVLSLSGTLIYYLVMPAYALELPESDQMIRVGLMYGDNVTVGFETDSPYGFFVSRVNRSGDLTHDLLWQLEESKVSCIVDANLSKTAMTYSKASSQADTVIGGYHAELDMEVKYYDEALELFETLTASLASLGFYPIPSYIHGTYRIRVGHFATIEQAAQCASELTAALGVSWNPASPTDTAVALVDPLTDTLLFEYDDADITALGLSARMSDSGQKAYLITPAKKQYDGVFMFRRYQSDAVDGVSLTNVIPLEEYVKGVLPYEINASWPEEAQRAFAICVRSYTLSQLNRHERYYQFDMCNTQHCQVYNGCSRITEAVEQAVEATNGMVMVSEGKIVQAYYSSSTGGVTVGADDAWGGSEIAHLVAVETPWEKYTNYSGGSWTVEVSPTELLTYLRDTKGYSYLKGKIESITIDQLAKNSTYVYQLTLTDSYGSKVVLKTTDNVRLGLAKYLNSANFVVGKGEVVAEQTTFTTVLPESLTVTDASGVWSLGNAPLSALTASGTIYTDAATAYTLTASGTKKLSGTDSTTETIVVSAEDPNNFIFVGKGWGHGVGLSQYGMLDLAKEGVAAEEILCKYFTGISILHWREV